MIRSQRGASMLTVTLIIAVVLFFVLLGFKCVPVFTEYFGIKRAIAQLVKESPNASPAEIKEKFTRKMSIEYAGAISADELDIQKRAGGVSIGAEYDKPVRLFGNDDGMHADLVFHFKIQEGSKEVGAE